MRIVFILCTRADRIYHMPCIWKQVGLGNLEQNISRALAMSPMERPFSYDELLLAHTPRAVQVSHSSLLDASISQTKP